ncbi:alanine:cation symporter family protein [Lysinibacillus sp. OL1_EC]|uniref:alanine/glycine:cation symporter family protein n=1 Tax=unclassified Lysinibacillus TaxID=2636778 RepID=UPI00103E0864|nr:MULTISPECIES: alanine/glycine:cation symporter family protein [unclassified Lysinibacillus]MCM0625534.1 alanine:cation symporter family protein [Lysinibacillus sp. OL1_EC]MCS5501112.1 alanine:cation symporter family protein [Lysinibacillus sp. A4]TBV86940.1 alanine:cation symporter family protein [Lysinibacillus sp. OL1]UKJ44516.1 alanine:cation symporter family protein [Lysinibacillus sp. ACHW1.5]WGT40022.1 alanine/glycine:cation symporter family protein [Lysinibacillus sp. 1 U-2021]
MDVIVEKLNGILWGPWFIYGILLIGLFFSIITRFLQVRHIKDMFVLMFKGEKSEKGISSFQAMSIALSGRVGTGNIAGTATAIGMGGPGAVFWMWAIAFIGAATAYVESTLAQIYKEEKDTEYRGGPAFYIEKGMGQKWFAVIFAVAALIAMLILMPGVQSNAIAGAVENAFGLDTWITGLIIVVLLGAIIIGGIKSIANAAQIIVPFMALAYIIMAIIIIFMNISQVPTVIGLIFSSAFGAQEIFGGVIGSAIAWGVKRGIYSNEAGQGTGAHPAAAAEVSHPAKQGIVQAASVYIDTLLICSATAFMILFTGMYNVQDEKAAEGADPFIHVGEFNSGGLAGDEQMTFAKSIEAGAAYTQYAVDSSLPGFGAPFVAIALFFFAFTTIMAYYYIAETNVAYLFRGSTEKIFIWIAKIAILVAAFYGTIRTSGLAWAMGDVGLGLMVWINVIAILIIMKPAIIALKDYEKQKKEGKDPVFDPRKLGIKGADFWVDYNEKRNNK